MGERPTTGAEVARTASRMPGTPRIVPTDTTGLDGGRITRSASAIASSTPGAGVAASWPTTSTASAGTAARRRTQYSWKWITDRPLGLSGSATAMCVSTRSSLIGSSERLPPWSGVSQRRHSASVTCDRVKPASSIWVRTRWVAMSRSPSPNHVGSTP